MDNTKGMSKAALARHLTRPHGAACLITPLAELRKWNREELVAAHKDLLRNGPCPSFRDSIVRKAG